MAYGRILVDLASANHSKSEPSWLLVTVTYAQAGYAYEEITLFEVNCASFRAFIRIDQVRRAIKVPYFEASQVFFILFVDYDTFYR